MLYAHRFAADANEVVSFELNHSAEMETVAIEIPNHAADNAVFRVGGGDC